MRERVATIRKAVVALIGGAVTLVSGVVAGEVVDINKWVEVGSSAVFLALTTYGVWRVPNQAPEAYARETLLGVLDGVSEVGNASQQKAESIRGDSE